MSASRVRASVTTPTVPPADQVKLGGAAKAIAPAAARNAHGLSITGPSQFS